MAAAGLKPECEVKKDKEKHNKNPSLQVEELSCVRINPPPQGSIVF